MKQITTKNNLTVPKFPKWVRDEILNYTDNKNHKSFIKLIDSLHLFKIIMGAKNISKSFGAMINTIYRIVNEPNFCSVWARNLSTDIVNTIHPTFQKALDFLKMKYEIDLVEHFDIYQKVVIFKSTGQAIFFANFELVNSFAGLTLKKYDFDICEVVFDEIQQNPDELGSSIEKIYAKQPKDMEFIKQSTILRTKRKPGQIRSMIFLFNIYDSSHWVCQRYVTPVLPFTKENRQKLLANNYLAAEDDHLDVSIMRMSRFYVPSSEIDEYQLKEYQQLKINDPKLYDITIAGEPYDQVNSYYIYPFKRHIYDDENNIDKSIILNVDEIDFKQAQIVVDGYDPGLRDNNGLVRVLLTNNNKIIVYFANEIKSKHFSNFKRLTVTEYVLTLITALNQRAGIENSILAIDSKEDTILELATKYCCEHELKIVPYRAIKNKNPNFKIDFNIANRAKFILECLQKHIIFFTPDTVALIEYLSMQAFDDNWKRDEKINPQIYDLVNAFEYALSIIYPNVIMQNQIESRL